LISPTAGAAVVPDATSGPVDRTAPGATDETIAATGPIGLAAARGVCAAEVAVARDETGVRTGAATVAVPVIVTVVGWAAEACDSVVVVAC
jgi:hypothetical protein